MASTGIERYNQTHFLVYNDSEMENNNNEEHWDQFKWVAIFFKNKQVGLKMEK